jgi:hypothetical protein
MINQNGFATPILFLLFNRPETTTAVFEQIKKIKPKYLYVAADGPRNHVEGEKEKCKETREIINNVDWECEVITLFRNENLGCGHAVSGAITWFFDQVDYGIILEDDCLPDLTFFAYCEELLIKYQNDAEVMLIGGNNFHKKDLAISSSYYFTNYSHIWGWASWKRAWKNYSFDISEYQKVLNDLYYNDIFQSKKEKKYWMNVFENVVNRKINTWDYQWTYAIWKNRGKSITPAVNLIKNIGLEGNSTHVFIKDSFRDYLKLSKMKFPLQHPSININKNLDKQTFNNVYGKSFSRAFRLLKENGVYSMFLFILKKIFR